MAMCGEIKIQDRPPLTALQSQWEAILQDLENDRETDKKIDNNPMHSDPHPQADADR